MKGLSTTHRQEIRPFFQLLEGGTTREGALKHFDQNWTDEHLPLFVEFFAFIGKEDIVTLLERTFPNYCSGASWSSKPLAQSGQMPWEILIAGSD